MLKSKHREVSEVIHKSQLEKINDNTDVLFIGASFFERLEWFQQIPFDKNIKILAKGGDMMEHLLWRIENTPKMENIKYIILNIGTNNLTSKFNENKINDFVAKLYFLIDKIKNNFPNAKIYYLPLIPREDIDTVIITSINSKIKSNNNFDFLEDFWTGIVDMTKYDKQFYEDHVHMNKETNTKFYDKLLTLIGN